MAAATDELALLERVFLCMGSADTDEKLQASVCKFLPPVLLKLTSTQEGVRKKVMALLIHINKRIKSRPTVQLPVEALLLQYQDPSASSFVINFTIIYIKLGYPRMEMKKQAELIPSVLNAIEGKPLPHQDSLMLIIMSALGHIQIPMDAGKRAALLGLQDKPNVAKHLVNFMLDMLLLPYGAMAQREDQQLSKPIDWSRYPVPAGLSEYAFKRVIGECPPQPEQLEQIKLGIVKFVAAGFFPEADIFVHLIVAAADTRFSVANLADMELRKMSSSLDWSSMPMALPLYTVFLGSSKFHTQKEVKADMKRLPANTRIRLKLLQYLCRVNQLGLVIPPAIQVVFDSLYGTNTNKKLKTLALEFTENMVQQGTLGRMIRVSGVVLNGMMKLITEAEVEHQAKAYKIIGLLGQRFPVLVNKDMSLIESFFQTLTTTDGELRKAVRDALVLMASSFTLDKTNEQGITLMNAFLSGHIESKEPSVRYVAVYYAATVFPSDDTASRYCLLLACGDEKNEVAEEAMKALYGTAQLKDRSERIEEKELSLPKFPALVLYINWHMRARIKSNRVIRVGNETLPYNLTTFNEIVFYLRLCLAKSANEKIRGNLDHPCEQTPILGRYLNELHSISPKYLACYLEIINCLNYATSDKLALNALLEVIGLISPELSDKFAEELPFIRGLLSSTKIEVRELSGKIHAIIMAHQAKPDDFDKCVNEFLVLTKNKTLEVQHGALVALTFMFERRLTLRKAIDSKETILTWKAYVNTVKIICDFLKNNSSLLIEAATQGIGTIARTYALPLKDNETINKKWIVDTLFEILTNAKMHHKVKEHAATSLGLLCLGEAFPHSKDIAEKFLELSKETKDFLTHIIIAEALVFCVQGQAAVEARDSWTCLPDEHKVDFSPENDNLLVFLLDQLLKQSKHTHPHSRQAVCIWLLAILRKNAKRKQILERLPEIQNAFMDFLSENNDIVQDVASKGICLVYDTSDVSQRETLMSNLLGQLSEGRRTVAQVTPDTKLFEEDQLGKSPTGASISTYKEIYSLASDLNNPDLIYKFLQLANHNAVWNSKRGAAFGFSAIARVAKDELNQYLPNIIPKLYRYQFDPTAKIQQSMASIWHAIVPSTQKALEQYHDEILDDLTINLTSHLYRVRISCCEGLSHVLKSNASINLEKYAAELWKQLFRVMDDIHEETREIATRTTKLLSKVCIRQCDPTCGRSSEQILQVILPALLNIGITNSVATVRVISVQTLAQLVSTAGALLKPSLVNLIPALLVATDFENSQFAYMRNSYVGHSDELQEAIDNVKLSAVKSHHAIDILKKCTQYIDGPILKELMPKVIDLMKTSISLDAKMITSHFLIFLSVQSKQELQPYAGKILTVLLNGLMDRNSAMRKTNAMTIGHVVGCAKDSTLEKMFNTLNNWYMDREDDNTRLAIGQTLQSINNQNHEVLKKFSDVVIPLTFFAMHVIAVTGNEQMVELWTGLWAEIAHGTESTIRQNLGLIIAKLKVALESASWTMKAQAANGVSTVGIQIGSDMDEEFRNGLLKILVNGLQGRTWNGKERLVCALNTLACNSKEALIKDPELMSMITEALYKESKKENLGYRKYALKAFAEVLHELEVDRFTQLYDIAQDILIKIAKQKDDSDDSDNRAPEQIQKREDQMKLQETVYEALGKAWPSTIESKSTQDQYCEQFVTHCHETLANSTRSIQVEIMITLTHFVDKLVLLKLSNDELTETDKERLNKICGILHEILRTAVGISKYTRIRKEALNIILTLSKKFINGNHEEQLNNIKTLFCALLIELSQDNQPEVRTRVNDIKSMLQI